MEHEMEDRRVRKTKKQLRAALMSLLLEKDISRITVRDVSDLADVNRGTFYAHYSDVFDLLHQIEDNMLSALDNVAVKHSAHVFDGSFDYLRDIINLASENSDTFYSICCRNGDTEFLVKLINKLKYQYLYEFLVLNAGGESPMLDYVASFIVSGICTMLRTWIENGMQETPEQITMLAGGLVINGVNSLVTAK